MGLVVRHQGAQWRGSFLFSRDGQLLASSSDDKTIRLWNTKDGTAVGSLLDHKAAVVSIHFSPDGTRLIVYTWGVVNVWDTAMRTVQRTVKLPRALTNARGRSSVPSSRRMGRSWQRLTKQLPLLCGTPSQWRYWSTFTVRTP